MGLRQRDRAEPGADGLKKEATAAGAVAMQRLPGARPPRPLQGRGAGDRVSCPHSNRSTVILRVRALAPPGASLSPPSLPFLQVSLHDYYILMPEAVAALEERERCLAHIHAMEDELAAKQGELARVGGGVGGGVGGTKYK